MAEAALQVLIENLTSLIGGKIGLIMGVDKEMKNLSKTLTTVQKVLEDAEDKQFQDQAIQNWLSELNDLAYEIEDILDECSTVVSKLNCKAGKFNLKKVLYKYKLGRKMKEAVEKLEAVAEDRHKFHLNEIVVRQWNQRDWRRETGSVLNEPDHIYGRDEEREKIVDMLVNQVSDQEKLAVLPIVGIGGMGKTTLAQFVYNDERVSQHFDTKLWVCVSDNFDLIAILNAMIESDNERTSNLDSLQRRARQELNEKRYLLILDDVWNDNQEDWFKLKSVLTCGSTGSSIIVTTRMEKVAEIMGTLPAHSLKQLSEENCLLLFRLRAFGLESERDHGNLETIGRRIVEKCAGVPLAAKALGGLLRFKREEKEWIHVEESHIWNLPQEENSILPILRLSYRHLPFVLKRCFAYCAVFQKDHEIKKTELIFCWMAQGYISSSRTQEVEDVGDQVWNELALRSFFQEIETSGGETTFKMHDLIHDLALSIMENKIPGAEMKNTTTSASNSKIREVCWSKYPKPSSSSIALQVHTTSTTILNSTTFMIYNRLRILKLKGSWIKELPIAIGKLKHLRYLKLKNSSIRTLPRTFHHLFNLQILHLNNCSNLESLPNNIIYMTNLRHIILEECFELSRMPSRIGKLASLKTLGLFIVGDKKGNQLDELEHLNLGGRLEIRNLENVKNHLNAKKANLVEKLNLRELVLCWENLYISSTETMDNEEVLKYLKPHLNLATLEISGFKGRELAPWMTKMKNLTKIVLSMCKYCTHLRPLEDLPLLKFLNLTFLDALEYIVEENEIRGEISVRPKFPSLKKLSLVFLPNLKGLLKEEGVAEMFPNLRSLIIHNCELLTSIPRGLNYLTKLELWECKIGSLGHLTTLEELKLSRCSELVNAVEDVKHFHLLKKLSLVDDDIVTLPQGLQHIPSLKYLIIHGLPQLTSLPDWLANLESLKKMIIVNCPLIPSLPSIPRMTNLKYLHISGCPQLQRRCDEENAGEDWPKIAHIPHLYIYRDSYDT